MTPFEELEEIFSSGFYQLLTYDSLKMAKKIKPISIVLGQYNIYTIKCLIEEWRQQRKKGNSNA